MKTIPLTKGYFATVDDADFENVGAFKWSARRDGKTVYAQRRKGKAFVQMHREILGLTDPKVLVDHRNGYGLDNRRCNLRTCCHAQNSANRGANRNNRLGYKGVAYRSDRQKFVAYIHAGGRQKFLGHFENAVDAATAYDRAAVEIYGEFAGTNF